MANELSEGIIIRVIEVGPLVFQWAMRKGDSEPFLRSSGMFAKARHAEMDARRVITRAKSTPMGTPSMVSRP